MTSSIAQHINCEPQMEGRIFNMQRYSLNDGTGIRTVVFFLKGCPLACPWCANPESRSHKVEYVIREAKCIHCDICPKTVEDCPSGAYERIGTDMTVDEVMKELKKDAVFYFTSNGGVTISGGEVLAQAPFAIELLKRLKAIGIRTAIETTGFGSRTQLLKMAALCDEVLYDFKIMDAAKAKEIIGIDLELVLRNFKAVVSSGVKVIPRIPLIPGYTMTISNLEKILAFLKPFELKELHLLPFHQFGASKYETLKMEYKLTNTKVPSVSEVEAYKNTANRKDIML